LEGVGGRVTPGEVTIFLCMYILLAFCVFEVAKGPF